MSNLLPVLSIYMFVFTFYNTTIKNDTTCSWYYWKMSLRPKPRVVPQSESDQRYERDKWLQNNKFISALLSLNKTSYDNLMSHLCDGQVAEIIETGWCVYPVWYSGGEEDSMLAFNAIKDAINASNNILNGEIQLAKRFKDTRRIGE